MSQDVRAMEVMPAKCRTCPFREGSGCADVAAGVMDRVLSSGSQVCHSTGHPIGTHLCRGARDFQLQIFHRLGVIEAATDEAWARKREELGV